jgi:cytochrome P450
VAARARAEVLAVAGSGREPLTARDLEGMPYLAAVTKEALRLYPPAPFTVRAAVKAGAALYGSSLLLHAF